MVASAINSVDLQKFAFFDGLSTSDLNHIITIIRQTRYVQGEYLFNTGESAHSLFLLIDGLVKVSFISIDGDEKVLDIFEAGDVLGDLWLGKYRHRIGHAMALDDVTVYKLTEHDLHSLIKQFPSLGINFIRRQADEQREMFARMHALLRADAKCRLLGTLLSLARHHCCAHGNTFTLNPLITQEDLANMTGLNRSTVSSIINKLRRQGILGGTGRSLTVDVGAVEQILEDEGFELLE